MSKPEARTAGSKTAVLVLGAPRSGTSALSHLLSEMGVYFGEEGDFLDPSVHTHNPAFFELKRLNELNERVLAELGYDYGSFDYFPGDAEPERAYGSGLTAQAKALVLEELGGRDLVGLKDPRFCFTLPFWRRILGDLGYEVRPVVAMRAVQQVVRSNRKVNKLQPELYNHRLTWLSMGAAAANVAGRPVMEVEYDHLVESPGDVAARLTAWLQLPETVVGRAAKVVRKEFRHEAASAPYGLPKIAEVAEDYLHLRARLESLGILELLSERRLQVADRDRVIAQQASTICQLAAASEPLIALRHQVASNQELLDHVRATIEWQSQALEGLGGFLRDRASSDSDAQGGLNAAIERHSHALEDLGDFLREAARVDGEARSTFALKLEWQSSAILGLGDFLRENAQAESAAQDHLVAKVQWLSDALAGFGEHLGQLVESNRLAQEQLHGEISRLNALVEGNARDAESQAEMLREQARDFERLLMERSAELDAAVAQRESMVREHARALEELETRASALERLSSELRREGDLRQGELDAAVAQRESMMREHARALEELETRAAALERLSSELRREGDLRQGELDAAVAQRESMMREHARALEELETRAAALERLSSELRREGDLRRAELDRVHAELSQSTDARLHAERRAAGFLERIEALTLQVEAARRPRKMDEPPPAGLFGRWKNKSAGSDTP